MGRKRHSAEEVINKPRHAGVSGRSSYSIGVLKMLPIFRQGPTSLAAIIKTSPSTSWRGATRGLRATRLNRHVLACMMLFAAASPASAGTVSLFSFNGGVNQTQNAPGLATLTFSDSRMFGQANAYEFTAGVGASSFATGRSRRMAAQATASYTSVFRTTNLEPAPGELGRFVEFDIRIDGTASASGQPSPTNPSVFGSSQATYSARWSLSVVGVGGAISGGGQFTVSFLDNGTTTTSVVGNPTSTTQRLYLTPGDVVTLSLTASTGAFTDPAGFFEGDFGPATAAADFSQTLAWGGVRNTYSSSGVPLGLGQLSLLGDDGFDYVNPAGPNPYVPAPGTASVAAVAVLALGRRRRKA